jgi:hypothetical protein
VTAFYVCGVALAVWAVLLAFLGITRENFPGTGGAARIVGGISVLLVLAAIGTAIYTSAHEEKEEGGESAVLALPV